MPIYQLGDKKPVIPASCYIADTAVIIGDVTLGERVSIMFGAVLRGDNELITIGENSNVQDGAVLHCDPGVPCTIGARVTVGHRAVVHGASVEDGSLIGIGAIVLNRAVVGAGSIVGAGALVPEGMVIPPGRPGIVCGVLGGSKSASFGSETAVASRSCLSSPFAVAAGKATSLLSLLASAATSTYGDLVRFTVGVTAEGATPTGRVVLRDGEDAIEIAQDRRGARKAAELGHTHEVFELPEVHPRRHAGTVMRGV